MVGHACLVLGRFLIAATTPEVRKALEGSRFPWYDRSTDRIRPMLPWLDFGSGWLGTIARWVEAVFRRVGDALRWVGSWFQWLGSWFRWMNRVRVPGVGGLGDLVAVGLAMLLLTLVIVGLLELLRRYRPLKDDPTRGKSTARPGAAERIEGLPAGVRFDAADPWAEAQRRRAAGDYAGAVIYLFAHQLLGLERLRQVRLTPGRTGRQIVRSVPDREIRSSVEPTLRLFEAVYYGQRSPSREAFEDAWDSARTLQDRLAAEAAL